MLGFLLGLQGGYTKYSCFLCMWNGRADGENYEKIHWPKQQELTPGMYNVIKEPLGNMENVLLPPLHIKLGLVKQFTKALDFESFSRNPYNVYQAIRVQNKRRNIRWSPNKHINKV